MAYTKKEPKQPSKGANALNSPEERKKFKSVLDTITSYMQQMDDLRAGVKETVDDLHDQYGLDKKVIRKMARTLYNHDYGVVTEENRLFEELYETIFEGKLRSEMIDDEEDDENE